jgi:5-methylthioadenosine/S-adenosylhomocysteine deaminase
MTNRLYSAEWVLPISSPPINNGAVAVENGTIAFVGPLAEARLNPVLASYDHQPLGRAALLPGFVNAHSHLELTLMRGFLEDLPFRDWIVKLTRTKYDQLTPDDLLASAKLGAAEAIRGGITTLADTADSAAAFEAMLAGGLRGIAFREVFGPDPAEVETSLNDLRQKVEQMRQRESALVRVGVSPHAPYTVSAELFRRVAEYAISDSLDVCVHAAESESERQFLLKGEGDFAEGLRSRAIPWSPPRISTIEYLHRLDVLASSPLLVHCVTVDDHDLEILAQNEARIAHCPKSNAKLGHGIAPLARMLMTGVSVGLGTDSVASNNTGDLIEEARFCSLIHRSAAHSFTIFSASDVLRLMTLGGAQALGLEAQIGTLEAGKRADLSCIDLSRTHNTPVHDPEAAIVFAAHASDVVLTIVAGRVLFEAGEVKSLDEQALQRQVEAAASRINP